MVNRSFILPLKVVYSKNLHSPVHSHISAMMVVATSQSAICSSGQCSRSAHGGCIIDTLVLFCFLTWYYAVYSLRWLYNMIQNKWLLSYVCVYLARVRRKSLFSHVLCFLTVWPDRRTTAHDLNVRYWSLTGLAVPSPTCCLSPVYWLDRTDRSLTGWEQTMLMTSSTCLAIPSPHQRSMGTDKEICLAIWLPTGLTLPELGKTLLSTLF